MKDLETAKHQAELARMMQTQLGQQQQAAGGSGSGAAGASPAGPSSGGAQPAFMQQGFGQAYPPGLCSTPPQGCVHVGCTEMTPVMLLRICGRCGSLNVMQG